MRTKCNLADACRNKKTHVNKLQRTLSVRNMHFVLSTCGRNFMEYELYLLYNVELDKQSSRNILRMPPWNILKCRIGQSSWNVLKCCIEISWNVEFLKYPEMPPRTEMSSSQGVLEISWNAASKYPYVPSKCQRNPFAVHLESVGELAFWYTLKTLPLNERADIFLDAKLTDSYSLEFWLCLLVHESHATPQTEVASFHCYSFGKCW